VCFTSPSAPKIRVANKKPTQKTPKKTTSKNQLKMFLWSAQEESPQRRKFNLKGEKIN
jgi:hypothetical protein